jgi:hypothetical protein
MGLEIAIEDMDELTSALSKDIENGGFDNKSVMWLVKGWTKIAILTNGPGYHKRASAYFLMKGDPPKLDAKSKRSKLLLRALEGYQQIMENNGTTGGDFFQRADRGMLDFVWDYRKNAGKGENDFVHQLQQWQGLSEDKVMQEVVFNMDRSA